MRSSYRFRTSIDDPEVFVQRLLEREEVIESDDPMPYPPGPTVLLNRDEPERPRLRHYSRPMHVSSPILQLQLRRCDVGLDVHCDFIGRHESFSAKERVLREEMKALDKQTSDGTEVLRWLWKKLVWDLWLDRLLHRRAVKKYGSTLLFAVKDVAEEDGIVGPSDGSY